MCFIDSMEYVFEIWKYGYKSTILENQHLKSDLFNQTTIIFFSQVVPREEKTSYLISC